MITITPFAWEDWHALWIIRLAQLAEDGISIDPATIPAQPNLEKLAMLVTTRRATPSDAAAILALNQAFDDVRATVEHIAEHIALRAQYQYLRQLTRERVHGERMDTPKPGDLRQEPAQ